MYLVAFTLLSLTNWFKEFSSGVGERSKDDGRLRQF
jgi:hypothetical protein